ncbi:MAG: Gfo/Idh/MocA family oxidoreductase [Clostridiaceae bacterium]|nr:Gfo/Idh/MocA family oxidoreductase [Clostridiaceae bacterium]
MKNLILPEISLGTIGTGKIVHSILDGAARTEGIHCTAVYSRSEAKGKALAKAYGVNTVYTDLSDLMTDPRVNLIYIASPNDLHYSQTKMALEHGKNVLCEKPLTPDKVQAEELVRLADEKSLLLLDAVPTLYLPNFQILKENLPRIGRVRLALSNFSQYSSRYNNLLAGEMPNVFSLSHAGGCLQDINFYNIYLNVALFGEPCEAVYYPNRKPGQADTSGVVVLRYNDFVSSCAGAKDTWGDNYVLIEGEQGYIRVKDGSAGLVEIRVVTRTSDETFNRQSDPDRWFYEIQEITRLMRAGECDVFEKNMAITVATLGIMEKARKAAGIYFEE